MKEVNWSSLPVKAASVFGVEVPEGSRTLRLGEGNRQIKLLFGDNSVAIMHHLGDRIANQLCPIEFDGITSWRLGNGEILFRREIAGFDETLKIDSEGRFRLGPTDGIDWVEVEEE